MKVIVITGSTRGIGLGLARAFLERNCSVVINGRKKEDVERVVNDLRKKYGESKIEGFAANVTSHEDLKALWQHTVNRFGRVDIWINNAGISTSPAPFWQHSADCIHNVVEVNLFGTMIGTKVAIEGMLAQGGGAVYNMEGLGSGGRQVPGMALYASTKASLKYFNDSMAAELNGKPVMLGMLSPGMVLTDMLVGPGRLREGQRWEQTKRIFNILADRVETVAPWLADRILENQKNGTRIQWLTGPKIMWRFISAPITKRNLFTEE